MTRLLRVSHQRDCRVQVFDAWCVCVCMCVCLSLNGALRLQVFQIPRGIAGAHVSMQGVVARRALLEHIETSRVGAL